QFGRWAGRSRNTFQLALAAVGEGRPVRYAGLLLVLSVSLLGSLSPAVAAPPGIDTDRKLPPLQQERSVPGEPVTVTPLPDSETARKAIDAMPQPVWPGNDHAVVDFADARTSSRNEDEQEPTYRQAGDLPVSIGLADTDDGPTASPAVGRRAVPGVRRNHLRRLRSDHLPNRRVGSDDEHRLRPRHGSDD